MTDVITSCIFNQIFIQLLMKKTRASRQQPKVDQNYRACNLEGELDT